MTEIQTAKTLHDNSYKETWEQSKKERFESLLLRLGWKVVHHRGRFIVENNGVRLETDNYGLFLWERKEQHVCAWTRTNGLSDDRCDEIFKHGNEPILKFKRSRNVNRFDLRTAIWTMARH